MLILSSYGLCSPIISKKARKYINPIGKSVLVIPFAGFNNEKTAEREITNGLVPFGFIKENIDICDATKLDNLKGKRYDWIYVPGGNPFKLLKEANDADILQWVRMLIMDGCNYFGISSGADFLCNNLNYLKLVDDCNYEMDDYSGLGIVYKKVLCHVDQRSIAMLQRIKDFDERETLFLRNDEIYVIGEEKK